MTTKKSYEQCNKCNHKQITITLTEQERDELLQKKTLIITRPHLGQIKLSIPYDFNGQLATENIAFDTLLYIGG